MNQYIICPKIGNLRPAAACRDHSAGEYKHRLVAKILEERCFGYVKWMDLIEQENKTKKNEINEGSKNIHDIKKRTAKT